ncbi:lysozyme-like domain protein [Vibrio phage 1.081.O._10N.286.52.C2]|nr:lysozyme-like domain protein [Vibrio phage 1.081.O._10N.286.52.C2]
MKRLFVIFALLIMSSTATAGIQECKFKSEFSDMQWYNIRDVFAQAWSADLSWTMSAIIIAESSAGSYTINHRTQDYGIMQNNIKTATTRLKEWEKDGRDFGPYDLDSQEDVRGLLLLNRDISIKLAIEEINFWKKVRGEHQWNEIFASYNGGYYHDTPRHERSESYSQKIVSIIRKLKPCASLLTKGLF